MHTQRLILAALLLATPMLLAQETGSQKAEAKAAADQGAAQPQPAPNLPDEAFRITITFKTTEAGKTTTQKSYMLVATPGQNFTGIRDNRRFTLTTDSNQSSLFNVNSDVDVGSFKKSGNSVYLSLKISTEDLADNPAAQAPNTHPIIRSRAYNVAPTLPIGKLVTVYSAVDAVNDAKVEIQVLVQPLDAK
jgi:hypothetical protein